MSEYRTVYPDRGNEKFVAEALLAVADDPSQVQVDSRPHPDRKSGPGFRVPVEVFERFSNMMIVTNTKAAEVIEAMVSAGGVAPVIIEATAEEIEKMKSEPVKPVKRAGRPKKAEEAE